ncbi:hypothetical protein, variant [Aphanomyces astaci]|uniref:ENTH domain-containing protein n=1 Tax=Aphanomyces astaci TaxID=112090 RepID=W4G0H4_APHAT|nr:hypothetical protein, variant [Aphanomyces astaci]ETV73202.1 hypothetical protein, variant [Aphanomyces astaci]|eukprot:XP_009837406.1 hypothetical protein, variant [Aphanomyces astaci]
MSRELLSEATSIHEGPVPGYLLDQISRQLGANDGTPADKIADFLLNRMGKSNMNVKLKAMQVINHCLKCGDAAFNHHIRQDEPTIRALSNFQGTADPAYGDEKNRRVRMAALEMLNYLGVPASFNKDGGPGTFMPQPFTTSPPANTNSWGNNPAAHSSQRGNVPPSAPHPSQNGQFRNPGASNGPWGSSPATSAPRSPPAPYRDTPPNAPSYGHNPQPPSQYGHNPPSQYRHNQQPAQPGPPQYGNSSHESSWRGSTTSSSTTGATSGPSKNAPGGVWSSSGYEKKEPTAQEMIPSRWNSARDNRPTVLIGPKTSLFGAARPMPPVVGNMQHQTSSSSGGFGSFVPPPAPPSSSSFGGPSAGHRGGGISGLSQPVSDRPKSSIEQTLDDVKRKGFMLKDMWDRRNMDRSMASSLAEHDDYVNRNATLDSRGQTYQPQPTTGSSDKSGEYERSLIDDLCPPGGLARAPPAENLARFLELAKSLDMTILGDLLLDKLEDDSWQVRLKGLCVWEALLEAPGCAHYADWLHENVDLLQHVGQDPKAAVATKAKRVLQLVGAEMSTPPVQKNQTQVDLLAMHDLNLQSPPFQPQNQNQTHAPPPENLLDLTFSPVQSVTATTDVPLLLLSPTAPLPPDASRHLGEFGKDLFTLANSPRNSPQPPAPQPEKSAFSFM